jgi:hypothetical protein
MNIWQFQNRVSARLLRWGLGSMVAGFLMRFGGRFWKNAGNQFIVWGLIDAAIAVIGHITSQDRIDRLQNPGAAEIKREEATQLSRLLWINTVLDVFYVIGGWLWMRRDRGNGVGVIIQGLFLFLFDLFHALNVPKNNDE